MAIDPDLYEKVTGRSPGDAQRRLGESLAKGVADRSKQQERLDQMRSMPRIGYKGVLLIWFLQRFGWKGVFALTVVCAAITAYLVLTR